MKKILFFFILTLIFIIIFSKENITSKSIEKNNILIEYPYFNKENIDNYISSYINKNLLKNSNDKIYIDYDYDSDKNIISLYKTIINEGIISEEETKLEIKNGNIKKLNIIKNNNIALTDTDYDFYKNSTINKEDKIIAFTFDDGPNYNTSKVIDVLNKYKVTATFFVMGKNIKGNEKVLEKLKESGMEIGNHTFNHKLLTKYSEEVIKEEIDKTSKLIYNTVGVYPNLLRPSYGSVNRKIKKIANMPIIIWDIDTLDWKYKNSKRIANKILNSVEDGDIILMHDIYKSTLNSLDIVIPKLLDNGYKIVSVSELFYYKNGKLDNGKVYGYCK